MYKKYLVLLILLCSIYQWELFGQQLNGLYKDEQQFMEFTNDTVKYSFQLGCCIINEYKGIGKWSLKNHKLLVEPINSEQTYINTTPAINNDTLYIHIEVDDTSRFALPTIALFKRKDKYFGTQKSDRHWAIAKKNIKGCDSLGITLYGYLSANCSLNQALDYHVKLGKGNDLTYVIPILKLNKGGLPIKIKSKKIKIKRLINRGHDVINDWVIYDKQ